MPNEYVSIKTVNSDQGDVANNETYIWKSLLMLSEKTYDIILLDYLLGTRPNGNGREYSHELLILLNNICNNVSGYKKNDAEKIKYYLPKNGIDDEILNNVINGIIKHKGPLGKFWIMNISSFHTAFLDRLHEQGFGYNSEHWNISRGGDPINTPALFRFSLFSIMLLQKNQGLLKSIDIIRFIYSKKIIDNRVNEWARMVFGEFILKFYTRDVLKFDKEEKSKFACSIIEVSKEQQFQSAFNLAEHFRHLLYLLAFDAGFNMQTVWEELQLIKRKIAEIKDKVNEDKDKENDFGELHKIFEVIECYIVKSLQQYNQ